MDRNGLRPSRYIVTSDDLVVMASEVGVLPIEESRIIKKGRLQPGKMFFVDLKEGRILADQEIKSQLASQKPYAQWLKEAQVNIENLPDPGSRPERTKDPLMQQIAFGYTNEDLKIVMAPMIDTGQEATGSMGNDAPLAVRSEKPQMLFNYFKQLFAQVTNPAIDSIREELVMSMEVTLGKERNLLAETPEHCRKLKLQHPLMTPAEFEKVKLLDQEDLKPVTLSMLFPIAEGKGRRAWRRLSKNCVNRLPTRLKRGPLS